MIKHNMSQTDRVIRLVAAAVILILFLTNVLTGTLAIILGIVAAILAVTAVVGFCPLYALLGLSTNRLQG
jgi:hypothetical protein